MLLRRFLFCAAIFCATVSCKNARQNPVHAKHVVLVVWDGMRPDFVTESGTPNLWKLGQTGVVFRNHHSFYPTATNVNGTVMATGVFPNRSGVIANQEFRPAIDPAAPMDTSVFKNIARGDQVTSGKYLAVPTIVELAQRSGKRTAVAGSKWVSKLFDRAQEAVSEAAQKSDALSAGEARPGAADRAIQDSLGKFPARTTPNVQEDAWTTAAMTETMWKDEVPALSVLWMSDPDFTEHDVAPGAPETLAGIKSVDADLGKLLAALEAKHLRQKTDVFIVSDHGFSTVERAVDVVALLNAAGFKAAKGFDGAPVAGTILAVGNGGTVLFYVIGGDSEITQHLVEWLQQSDFAGPIFTREKMEGAFELATIHLDKENGPDVVMSFRWNEKANQFGTPGMIDADWARPAGKGTHATLSRFDVHNTLIAAGPDFRVGYKDEAPTGNIDVAPTILHILGLTAPEKLDGRVLSEAMIDRSGNESPKIESRMMEATRQFGSASRRQYLKISTAAGKDYFDEGNASLTSSGTR